MYANKVKFLSYISNTIRTNVYSYNPYREIALIDAIAEVDGIRQRCTLPFYRSSGTNDEKIEGQWYPVLGIKEHDGEFDEFSPWINLLMNKTVKEAEEGWLVKSLFFARPLKYSSESDIPTEMQSLRGYGYTSHGNFLKAVAKFIEIEFDSSNTEEYCNLDVVAFNDAIYEKELIDINGQSKGQSVITAIASDIYNELIQK